MISTCSQVIFLNISLHIINKPRLLRPLPQKKCSGEVLRVNDKYFHTHCFQCCECQTSLASGKIPFFNLISFLRDAFSFPARYETQNYFNLKTDLRIFSHKSSVSDTFWRVMCQRCLVWIFYPLQISVYVNCWVLLMSYFRINNICPFKTLMGKSDLLLKTPIPFMNHDEIQDTLAIPYGESSLCQQCVTQWRTNW